MHKEYIPIQIFTNGVKIVLLESKLDFYVYHKKYEAYNFLFKWCKSFILAPTYMKKGTQYIENWVKYVNLNPHTRKYKSCYKMQ